MCQGECVKGVVVVGLDESEKWLYIGSTKMHAKDLESAHDACTHMDMCRSQVSMERWEGQ